MTYLFCPRSRPKTVTLSDILVTRLERASDLSFLPALSSQDRHSLRHSCYKTRASERLIYFSLALVPRPSLSQTFSSQDSSERVTYLFCTRSRPKTVTLSDILVTRLEGASDLIYFALALFPRPSLSQTFSSQDSSERVTYLFCPRFRPKTVKLSDILVTRLERASDLSFFARALVPRPSLSQTFSSQDSSERVTYLFCPRSRPKTVTLSNILVTKLERASDLSFLLALSSQDRHSLRHSRYKTRASE